MKTIEVRSSALSTFVYDEQRAVLQVQFSDSSVYEYFGVPLNVLRDFVNSESKGQYFNRVIRAGFQFRRLLS